VSERPWYKHYPDDFLTGVVGLGPDLIGAYVVILDLIYAHGGPIQNDQRRLAGILGCSARMAKLLIQRLIVAGKLTTRDDGLLSNSRAENELKVVQNSCKNPAKIPRKSAEKTVVLNENNDLAPRGRARAPARVFQNPESRQKEEEKVGKGSTTRAAASSPRPAPRSDKPLPDGANKFEALSASLGNVLAGVVDTGNVRPITTGVEWSDAEVEAFAKRYPDVGDMRRRLRDLVAWALSAGLSRPNEIKRIVARALEKRDGANKLAAHAAKLAQEPTA
jgi:uncharacterized protein YdaU (DUF1376 family)